MKIDGNIKIDDNGTDLISLKELYNKLNDLSNQIVDTNWTTIGDYVQYKRWGKVIVISAFCSGWKALTPNTYTVVGTLPVGNRPSREIPFKWSSVGSDFGFNGIIRTNGNIELYLDNTANYKWWCFSVSFTV